MIWLTNTRITILEMSMFFLFFFFSITIMNPSQARTLANPNPNPRHHHHHKMSFLMQDVLNLNQSSKPATTKLTNQLPFSKPIGFFPPNKGTLLTQPYQSSPDTTTNMGLSFASMATARELQYGALTVIDEVLLQGHDELRVFGRAQGMYVDASSDDGSRSSHMMALTASLSVDDGLKFFGEHRSDVSESHIAVIGGTGKYQSANGYATVKTVNVGQKDGENKPKRLLFNVYLSP